MDYDLKTLDELFQVVQLSLAKIFKNLLWCVCEQRYLSKFWYRWNKRPVKSLWHSPFQWSLILSGHSSKYSPMSVRWMSGWLVYPVECWRVVWVWWIRGRHVPQWLMGHGSWWALACQVNHWRIVSWLEITLKRNNNVKIWMSKTVTFCFFELYWFVYCGTLLYNPPPH